MALPHGCPIPLPIPGCGVGGLANQIVLTLLNAVVGWVASAAGWLLSMVGAALASSTSPPVTSAWFLARQQVVLGVAAPIALLAMVGAAIHALLHGTGTELWRTVLVRLPVAVLLGGAAAGIVGLALSATDQVCSMLSSGSGSSLSTTMRALALAVQATGGLPGGVALITTALVVAGALVLWVELIVRAAAIIVATAVLPLVFAASLWPPGIAWARRVVETLGALIISKAVIVLVLSIALAAVAHAGTGASTALTGGALLMLASFMPFAVLRLVPAFEAAAVSHLEAVRHRASAAVQQGTRQAVSMALGAPALGAVPGIDEVGSNPIGMMPGTDADIITGTALDPNATFAWTRPPLKAVPASAGTHVWERDDCGPRLVWKPPGHVDSA